MNLLVASLAILIGILEFLKETIIKKTISKAGIVICVAIIAIVSCYKSYEDDKKELKSKKSINRILQKDCEQIIGSFYGYSIDKKRYNDSIAFNIAVSSIRLGGDHLKNVCNIFSNNIETKQKASILKLADLTTERIRHFPTDIYYRKEVDSLLQEVIGRSYISFVNFEY